MWPKALHHLDPQLFSPKISLLVRALNTLITLASLSSHEYARLLHTWAFSHAIPCVRTVLLLLYILLVSDLFPLNTITMWRSSLDSIWIDFTPSLQSFNFSLVSWQHNHYFYFTICLSTLLHVFVCFLWEGVQCSSSYCRWGSNPSFITYWTMDFGKVN